MNILTADTTAVSVEIS